MQSLIRLDTAKLITSLLIEQSLEKIDKVRVHALHVLFRILCSSLPIPDKALLLQFFPSGTNLANFISSGLDASSSYSILAPCLEMDSYRYHATVGFVTSVGGMGKNVSDISTKFLLEYVGKASRKHQALFLGSIISIFQTHPKDERVIVPALKTLSMLCDVLWGSAKDEQADTTVAQLREIVKLCGPEVRGSTEVQKLGAFIEFAGAAHMCVGVDSTTNLSLVALLLGLLSHRYPLLPLTLPSSPDRLESMGSGA